MTRKKGAPKIFIIAGPNGAGKTTFATTFLPDYAQCEHFVNPDLIAKGISPFSPEEAAMKSGRILLEQIQELADKQVDFAFETTLSGVTYLKLLKQFKSQGYTLHLFYLWVPDVELTIARIKDRVKRGGHHVPTKDVRRRFSRSLRNLFEKYRPLLDSWTLFDNSSQKPRMIAKEEKGKIHIVDPTIFDKIVTGGKK